VTFLRYPSLARLGSQEVEEILLGNVTAFYKIDGTNSCIWFKDRIRFGSRNRELDIHNDNAGFMNVMMADARVQHFFSGDNCKYRLYGEWLVPHSLKTYREDAWRRFYVFDVYDTEKEQFLSYEAYKPILDLYGFDYIPPLADMVNPTTDQCINLLDKTGQFLVEYGKGNGEGIVFKNYDFVNKYGRTTWAKLISNEFKEVHHKEMGAPLVLGSKLVEDEIVDKYVTEAFVLKEQAKIIAASEYFDILYDENSVAWDNKKIPELLGRVWYELLNEEAANFVKEHKLPTINFKTLQSLTYRKVKKVIGL